jgi:hypothetical protein
VIRASVLRNVGLSVIERPPTEAGSLIPDAVLLLFKRQAGAIPMVFHRSPGKKMTGLRALDVGFVVARVFAR